MKRVLIVEDSDLGSVLQANIEMEGYAVELAANGAAGLDRARNGAPDLVLLDLTLPDLDGLHILRALRQEKRTMPVMVLTARGQESDKVLALKLGADDYLTKPFGLLELLARVEALLRRAGPRENAEQTFAFADIAVDVATRTVMRAGRAVELAPKEFDLLVALLRAEGALVSREELLRRVWGYRSVAMTRTLDTHVAALRRKLEARAASPRHILTVRKAGYRIEP